MSITEWLDCGVVYKLYESMLRLVKDTENVDQRQNCFLLQTSNGVSRYFSMETKQGLLDVQCAWHRSICTSMMHIKVSFVVINTHMHDLFFSKDNLQTKTHLQNTIRNFSQNMISVVSKLHISNITVLWKMFYVIIILG